MEDPEAGTRPQWWVECADPFGRCRAMNVVIQRGQVVVVAPPGQAAVLSAAQTRALGRALAEAAELRAAGIGTVQHTIPLTHAVHHAGVAPD